MQKTIYCCDICEKQINYPIADSRRDWTHVETASGAKVYICSSCAHCLRKARDLGIVLNPSLSTGQVYAGGYFAGGTLGPYVEAAYRNIAESDTLPTPYVDPE